MWVVLRAIASGSILIALAILVQPFLRPYEVEIYRGEVVRTNRVTGEVVVCGRGTCARVIATGPFTE